jgi:hypothetical protein
MLSIISTTTRNVLVVKADFSLRVLHEIGEALTSTASNEDLSAFAAVVRHTFKAEEAYRWYCVDATDTRCLLTFSTLPNPKLLQFRGTPVQIAPVDACSQALWVKPVDVVRPSWRKDRIPATFIGTQS